MASPMVSWKQMLEDTVPRLRKPISRHQLLLDLHTISNLCLNDIIRIHLYKSGALDILVRLLDKILSGQLMDFKIPTISGSICAFQMQEQVDAQPDKDEEQYDDELIDQVSHAISNISSTAIDRGTEMFTFGSVQFAITQLSYCDGQLGWQVWDSAKIFCQWLSRGHARHLFHSKSVIEIGAGVGLCGIAVCAFGKPASLVATDFNEHCVAACRSNFSGNASLLPPCVVSAEQLDWKDPSRFLDSHEKFDALIGTDLVYDEDIGGFLASTISRCLKDEGITYIICPIERQTMGILLFLDSMKSEGFVDLRINACLKSNRDLGFLFFVFVRERFLDKHAHLLENDAEALQIATFAEFKKLQAVYDASESESM